MKKERKFSPYFYNWITYFGVWIAFFVFLIECFLFIIDYYAHGSNLYFGLLTYLILPPFLILGLILIPVGYFRRRYLVKHHQASLNPKPLIINPSIPTHRNVIFTFMTGTFLLVVMSLVGAYKSFHYTESVKFCGLLCHSVMAPEYTTYLHSPHAKVKCVECHIGEGAEHYMHSKVSGMRQVYKLATKSFERPIKTPVLDLRPAEQTCKQCHWPGKTFGAMDVRYSYFLSEKENPRWDVRMLMKVGAGDHQSSGVHEHMSLDKEIYYVAEDRARQKISWIKSVDKEGQETIFTSPGSKYAKKTPPQELIRKMDCIDCHNRPTHRFEPPYRIVNDALRFGDLDPAIPSIKEKAVEVLSKKYETGEDARAGIYESLDVYYQKKFPEFYAQNKSQIKNAADFLARAFSENIFPEMKVRWDTHADNIGHMVSDGCFRCHDGGHKSSDNKVITHDCASCHLIVEQGAPGAAEKNIDGLEFKHPGGGDEWKDSNCTDCHTGGS